MAPPAVAKPRPQPVSTTGATLLAPQWFVATDKFPARIGNTIQPLVDGEQAFAEIHDAIVRAEKSVHIVIWWLEPGLRLRRGASSAADKTVGELLVECGKRGVQVRIIVWATSLALTSPVNVYPINPIINPMLLPPIQVNPMHNKEDYAWIQAAGKGEFANIRLFAEDSGWLGSHHQKAIVIDGGDPEKCVAFVMGMNLRRTDWDKSEHTYTPGLRDPGEGPRHDLSALVRGPVAFDVDRNFRERWNALDKAEKLPDLGSYDLTVASKRGGVTRTAQLLRTMPDDDPVYPKAVEANIITCYLQAIGNAQKYIYIEDQYFRSQEISRALVARKKVRPDLQLVVVTVPIWEKIPTSTLTRNAMEPVNRAYGPSFYKLMVSGRSKWWFGGTAYKDVNVHAKIMIVDDVFMVIGSANIHERGMHHDSELVVAALDPERAGRLRVQLWAEHLQASGAALGDVSAGVDLWRAQATENARLHEADLPLVGRVLPLIQQAFLEKVPPIDPYVYAPQDEPKIG
jgi:phosphatidylserine/phosphatidylglycerophosphate/cardiolipin synthase-like enzyme